MSFDSLFNILLIILGFGLLIGIHELGHFLAAKWSGIRTNAFAIGMGPQVISYRKGIGLCYKSTSPKVMQKCGKDANLMSDEELKKYGISETEYSLRLLPIGGFVSMLGQEDGKPDEVSKDLRSYNMCPIGKRMIVVSAGVIMNLLLAGVFFLICFQIGVNFEAPIVGYIIPNSPASKAFSQSPAVTPLKSGDRVVSVDGKPAKTFQDIQIAGAMAKPGVPVVLEVQRFDALDGIQENLTFSILPESVTQKGLLELGLYPSVSLTLRKGDESEQALAMLKDQYDSLQKLRPGMTMTAVASELDVEIIGKLNWRPISQWDDLQRFLNSPFGSFDIKTKWSDGDSTIQITLGTFPSLEVLRPVGIAENAPQNFEYGFMGLVPLSKINYVLETSPNISILNRGDVITKVASLEAPRMGQLRNFLALQSDGNIEIDVLRDGVVTNVTATLQDGKLGVLLVSALETPIFAQPLQEVLVEDANGILIPTPTAIAGQQLLGGATFIAVDSINEQDVDNWSQLRGSLYYAFGSSNAAPHRASIIAQNPTKNKELVSIALSPMIKRSAPKNTTVLPQQMFEPVYVLRNSGGNPIKALQMGFDETVNMVVMTYLTIDRLIRRTVGVDQLRGPVGIIHIGSKIADRGFSYLLFFLAIISVNLAVLNFLPLPIVDGGLFLYLIYEKLFKKPPSIAFQNIAAMLGLGLIATLFIVTFYNDIVRLVS